MPEENKTAGSPFYESNSFSEGTQRVTVDPNRLKLVKIRNVNGRTFITGTSQPEIRVHTLAPDGSSPSPSIELKNDGREAEIQASFGRKLLLKFFDNAPLDFDPDQGETGNQPDFDAGEETSPWNSGKGWENSRGEASLPGFKPGMAGDFKAAFRQSREEERAARAEAGAEKKRAWHERDAARAAARGIFGDFDLENFMGISIAQTISKGFEMAGISGDIYIEVPDGVDLEVKSVSGRVEVKNIKGFCYLKSTSGDVSLSNLSGGAEIKGVSGSISGQGLKGRVEIKLQSGRAELTNCTLSGLEISSQSGRIEVETALADPVESEFKINSSSGKIRFLVPRNTRASVDCRSLSGRVTAASEMGPVESKNRPGQNQSRIHLNGGGPKVSINTLSGGIELGFLADAEGTAGNPDNLRDVREKPGNWPPPPSRPVPPVPPVPPTSSRGSGSGLPATPPGGFGDFPPPPRPGQAPPTPPVAGDVLVPTTGPVSETPETGPLVTPPPSPGWGPVGPAQTAEQTPVNQTGPASSKPAQEKSPASEEEKKQRQLEVLKAIEKGEISVEEGLARLSRLEEV